jgi:hypothetical protein
MKSNNPIQILGLFIFGIEIILSSALWAIKDLNIRYASEFLIFCIGIGLILYLSITGFLVIYLAIKKPQYLYNPTDYNIDTHKSLFGQEQLEIVTVNNEDVLLK